MRFKATVTTKLFRFASLDAHIIQQLCPEGSEQMDLVECYDPSEGDWIVHGKYDYWTVPETGRILCREIGLGNGAKGMFEETSKFRRTEEKTKKS